MSHRSGWGEVVTRTAHSAATHRRAALGTILVNANLSHCSSQTPRERCLAMIMIHRNVARQHKVAKVACYRLERTLMGLLRSPLCIRVL